MALTDIGLSDYYTFDDKKEGSGAGDLDSISLDDYYKVEDSLKTIDIAAGPTVDLARQRREDPGLSGAAKQLPRGVVHGTLGLGESLGTAAQAYGRELMEGPQRISDLTMAQQIDFGQRVQNYAAQGISIPDAKTQALWELRQKHRKDIEGTAKFIEGQGDIISAYWGGQAKKWEAPEGIKGKNVWDDPQLLKSPTWWLYNVGDMLPSLAATIAPAGGTYRGIKVLGSMSKMSPDKVARLAKLGASLTGGATGGSLEATGTYKAVINKGGSHQEAMDAAKMMFFASASLNSLSISAFLKKAGPTFLGKVKQRGLSGVVEGLTEGAEEPADVISQLIAMDVNGRELPSNIREMLVDSLKDGMSVALIAAVPGVAAGSTMQSHRNQADADASKIAQQLYVEAKRLYAEGKKQELFERSPEMTEAQVNEQLATSELKLMKLLDTTVKKEQQRFEDGAYWSQSSAINQKALTEYGELEATVAADVDSALRDAMANTEVALSEMQPEAYANEQTFRDAEDIMRADIENYDAMLAKSNELFSLYQKKQKGILDVLPSDKVTNNGKPFQTAGTALTRLRRDYDETTHYIAPVSEGFVLREIPAEFAGNLVMRPSNTQGLLRISDAIVQSSIIEELSNPNSPLRFLYDQAAKYDYKVYVGDPHNQDADVDLQGNLGLHVGSDRWLGVNLESNRLHYKTVNERVNKAIDTLIHEMIHAAVYTNLHIRWGSSDPAINTLNDLIMEKRASDPHAAVDLVNKINESMKKQRRQSTAWYESVRDIWESIPQEEINKIRNKPWEQRTDAEKMVFNRISQIEGNYYSYSAGARQTSQLVQDRLNMPLDQRSEDAAYKFAIKAFEEVITSLSSKAFQDWVRSIPYTMSSLEQEGRRPKKRKTLWHRLIGAYIGAVNLNDDVPSNILEALQRNLNKHIYTTEYETMTNPERNALTEVVKNREKKAPVMVAPKAGAKPEHVKLAHRVSAALDVGIRADGSMDGLAYFTVMPDEKRGIHADTFAMPDNEVSYIRINSQAQEKLLMREDVGTELSEVLSRMDTERKGWLAKGVSLIGKIEPQYWISKWTDPAMSAYQRVLGDRVWKFLSETAPQWGANKSKALDTLFTYVFDDFAKTDQYLDWFREHELEIHRWNLIAREMQTQLDKLTPVEQLRAAQIAQGSITMKNRKYNAAIRAMRRFMRLETKLSDLGLLNDHQFRALTRSELAKAQRYIDSITETLDQIEREIRKPGTTGRIKGGFIASLNGSLGTQFKSVKDLIDARTETIVRMQIHYKNSGKRYLSNIYERIEKAEGLTKAWDDMKRFNDMRIQRKWAIRRDNWRVDPHEDGTVTVTRKDTDNKKLKSVGERVVKGINREIHDAAVFGLFKRILDSNMAGSDWIGKGKQLPKTSSLGPLKEQWVDPHIFNDLMEFGRETSAATKMYKKLYNKWKAGKTIWNPATQGRNILSNMILAGMTADVNLANPAILLPGLKTAYDIVAGKHVEGFAKEIKFDTLLVDSGFVEGELESVGDLISDETWENWKGGTNSDMVAKLLDIMQTVSHSKKAGKLPRALYSVIESGMKSAIYQKLRERGVKPLEAEKIATKSLFDYKKVPRGIAWARHWYSPFITFAYKATPRLAETTIRKPWKMAKYFGALYGLQALANFWSGDDDEEIDEERRFLPERVGSKTIGGFVSHVRMPWKDDDGRSIYLDLSYILPWGDFNESWGQMDIGYRVMMPNHPVLNFFSNVRANENVFLHQELSPTYNEGGETMIALLKHAYEEFAPNNPMIPGTYRWNKVMGAILGDEDWRGRDYSVGYALADVAIGLKFRTIDPSEEKRWRATELGEEIKAIRKDFEKKHKKLKGKTKRYSEERMEREDEKLWEWFNDEMEDVKDRWYYLRTGEERERE
jgi:hypothetical protein